MLHFYTSGFWFLLGVIIGIIVTVILQVKGYLNYNYQEDKEENLVPLKEKKEEIIPNIKFINLDKLKEKFEKSKFDAKQFEKLIIKESFENLLKDKMKEYEAKEDYNASEFFRIKKDEIDIWFDDRKQFFLDNIGKRVIPDRINCDCDTCKKALKEGVVIETKDHALQLFSNELNGILEMSIVIYSLM